MTLQQAFEQAIHDLPQQIVGALIREKLRSHGIHLSQAKSEKIGKQLVDSATTDIPLQRWRFWDRRDITIEFTEDDQQQVMKWLESFSENGIKNLVDEISTSASRSILETLKRNWSSHRRSQRRQLLGFQRRLNKRWGLAIDKLRMFVTICREFGSDLNKDFCDQIASSTPNLADTLFRLHGRGCQIAEEIITLLEGGFADGAMARWRTLHEISVVMIFVRQHGEGLAERYIDHHSVEAYRAANQYQSYYARMGYTPIDDLEMARLRNNFDQVIAKYGRNFGTSYGWAALALNVSDPNFAQIEQAANIDHLRPFYRMASHNVHANPMGAFFRLGLLPETAVILAGPSNFGLADPGQSTVISLSQQCTSVGLLHTTLDTIVAMRIVVKLVDEIVDEFVVANEQLQIDAAQAGQS